MPINDFKPIATDVGAPVLSQAAWIAAVPGAGRGPGIVPKEYFNKANRQSSVMAAAIGLFLNNQGQDALDNGDIPALAAAFAAALGGANAPAFFSLRQQDAYAGAVSRVIACVPGTYQVSLDTRVAVVDDAIGGSYNMTCTQSGIISGGPGVTLNSSIRLLRGGSSGYGREPMIGALQVGTFTLAVATAVTMTLTIATRPSVQISSRGSILTVERVA